MSSPVFEKMTRLTAEISENLNLAMRISEKNFVSFFEKRGLERPETFHGITPFDVIFSFDSMRVLRFKRAETVSSSKNGSSMEFCEHGAFVANNPLGNDPFQNPLLLIPSMINRSYIFDLMEGNSLVEAMVTNGLPTYLIDWGDPGPQHDHLPFHFFVDDLISMAVRAVVEDSRRSKIGILGYCMGGTMALLHAAMYPDKVDRLTLLASPVNFHDEGSFSLWSRKEVFDVDKFIEVAGHVDALSLQSFFLIMKPLSYFQKLKSAYENCIDPNKFRNFVKLEAWVNDNANVPGRAYAEFVKLCYHENKLIEKVFDFGKRKIRLEEISCPILNVMAKKDHIVPMESSKIIKELVKGPVSETIIDAGHIGLVMGRKAKGLFEAVFRFHSQ